MAASPSVEVLLPQLLCGGFRLHMPKFLTRRRDCSIFSCCSLAQFYRNLHPPSTTKPRLGPMASMTESSPLQLLCLWIGVCDIISFTCSASLPRRLPHEYVVSRTISESPCPVPFSLLTVLDCNLCQSLLKPPGCLVVPSRRTLVQVVVP